MWIKPHPVLVIQRLDWIQTANSWVVTFENHNARFDNNSTSASRASANYLQSKESLASSKLCKGYWLNEAGSAPHGHLLEHELRPVRLCTMWVLLHEHRHALTDCEERTMVMKRSILAAELNIMSLWLSIWCPPNELNADLRVMLRLVCEERARVNANPATF